MLFNPKPPHVLALISNELRVLKHDQPTEFLRLIGFLHLDNIVKEGLVAGLNRCGDHCIEIPKASYAYGDRSPPQGIAGSTDELGRVDAALGFSLCCHRPLSADRKEARAIWAGCLSVYRRSNYSVSHGRDQ